MLNHFRVKKIKDIAFWIFFYKFPFPFLNSYCAGMVNYYSASANWIKILFSYLIASMGLEFLWSFGLVCIEVHALKFYKDLHNQIIMSLFAVGDWVTNSSLASFLSLLPQEHAIITSITVN